MDDVTTITPDITQESRGIGLSEPTLLNPATVRSDARLVARAIKERWNIPEEKRPAIVGRLLDIVGKTHVTVMTKTGPEELDDKADVNAIAAARVLVAMEGQNQADEKSPLQTNIQINVDPAEAAGIRVYLPDNGRG